MYGDGSLPVLLGEVQLLAEAGAGSLPARFGAGSLLASPNRAPDWRTRAALLVSVNTPRGRPRTESVACPRRRPLHVSSSLQLALRDAAGTVHEKLTCTRRGRTSLSTTRLRPLLAARRQVDGSPPESVTASWVRCPARTTVAPASRGVPEPSAGEQIMLTATAKARGARRNLCRSASFIAPFPHRDLRFTPLIVGRPVTLERLPARRTGAMTASAGAKVRAQRTTKTHY